MSSIVDFSYLEDMAEGKAEFVQQVLTIFMENTPKGLKELEQLVSSRANFDKIHKQAHFLKSSFGIVKVEGLHERLQQMEINARTKKEREVIGELMLEITAIFDKAEPIIKAKMEQL